MENNFNWQLLRKLQIKKWRSTILKIHNLPRRICYQRNPPQKSERNPPKLTRYVIFDGSLLLKFWSDSSPFQKREILVYQFSWRLATSEKILQVFHPFPILSCCLFGSPHQIGRLIHFWLALREILYCLGHLVEILVQREPKRNSTKKVSEVPKLNYPDFVTNAD